MSDNAGAENITTNNSVELYNLEDDLGKHEDLASQETEIRDELVKEIMGYHRSTDRQMLRSRLKRIPAIMLMLKK